MLVDDSIVLKYFSSEDANEISNHWVFRKIEEGKHLFEVPNVEERADINRILSDMRSILSEFRPLNENIYSTLYPEWKSIIAKMNILLVVGCLNPYDAMVREYDGNQYIIFDLIHLCNYKIQGYNIELVIKQLITHETSHLCLRKKYPVPSSNCFLEH